MAAKSHRIHLAWLQLRWDKRRLFAAVSGIVFAVALMLIQLGFSEALFRAAVHLHKRLNGELVLLSSQYEYLVSTKGFSRRYLYQTLAFPEVDSVSSLYCGLGRWKSPQNHRELPIFVLGIDADSPGVDIPGVNSRLPQSRLRETVFFDEGSKPEYGPMRAMLGRGETAVTELCGHRVEVAGMCSLGLSFAADANVITSHQNFLRIMPGRQEGIVDIGVVRLRPGASAEQSRAQIAATLPAGVQVLTREQFEEYEREYWARRTPIGFIFTLGAIVGFVVGAVIVYQILYTDVTDHLREYATLKAIGFSDRYLCGVVIQEALLLAAAGFVPGCLISTGIEILTRKITLLPCYMTWERASLVLGLTLFMCTVSGLVAMRKLRSADPADIF